MKKIVKRDYVVGDDPVSMTPGQMLAVLRNLQGFTQNELAKKTKMTQANISSLESGRQQIGRERAVVLAKALRVHPAVIMFPNYRVLDQAA